MKKIILSLTLLSFSFLSFSQYVDYGLRLSAGYLSLGDNHKGVSLETGLFFKADLKDRAGIGAEVLIGGRFASYTEDKEEDRFDPISFETSKRKYQDKSSVSVTAINIPLYVYFPFSKHLTLELGGVISSSGSGKESTTTGITDGDNQEYTSVNYDPKGGLLFGVKYSPSKNTELGLRYMTTRASEETSEPSENSTSTNFSQSSVIQFNAGFLINW